MSEYFESNPDPLAEGCLITQLHEPGVVFPEIDTFGYAHCFIGRTALVEAVAKVMGLTPDDVNAVESYVPRIAELETELGIVTAELERFRDVVTRLFAAVDVVKPEHELDERPPADKPKRARKKPAAEPPADLE